MRKFLVSLLVFAAVVLPSLSVVGAEKTDGERIKPTLPAAWLSAFKWRSIGPANMSGRITAIAAYEKDPCIWWAASASGGLLKTTNNGITFEHQFDREATVSIGDVQVTQSDPNIVWVGTGEANPRNSVSWGDGVYRSSDGGKTWKNMGLRKSFQIGRIAIHPEDPNTVYVGALGRLWGPSEERGLYKTTDGGKTWKRILFIDDKTGVIDVQMHPKNPDTLLVATYERQRDGFDGNAPGKKFGAGSGIYKTTDGGQTFKQLTQGLPSCKLGRIGLSYYRKNPAVVYAVLESEKVGKEPENAAFAGIRGQDAEVGAKLTQVTKDGPADKAGLKTGDIVIGVDGKNVLSYNDMVKQFRQHVAGDKAKLLVSRERKAIECEIEFGKRPAPTEEAANRAGPGGRGGGGRRSRQPRTPFTASLGGQQPNLQDQQGKDGHQYGGVYKSEDGGETWTRINSVNPRPMYYSQIRVDPEDNNHIFVLGTSLYRSKDGGKTFTPDGARRGVHVDHHAMWIDPRDGRHIILGNDGGIYVTYDRAANWDHHNHVAIGQFYHVGVGPRRNYRVYGGLQDNGSWGGPSRVRHGSGPVNTDWLSIGGGDGFICLVDPTDADQIYFESQNGAMGRINLRTGDRGFIRPRPPRGKRYRFNWKTPFILSHHNPKIHYSVGNHVFRSVKKGDAVREISPEITRTDKGSGSAISESSLDENVLYAGTTDGAFWMTRDGGKSWIDVFEYPEEEKKEEQQAAGPERGRRGGGRLLQSLKERDQNGDGKIQKSEVSGRMTRFFDRLDANKDGELDEEELKAASRGRGGPPRETGSEPPAEKPAESAEAEEAKDPAEAEEAKDPAEAKEAKDPAEAKEAKDPAEAKEADPAEAEEAKDPAEAKEADPPAGEKTTASGDQQKEEEAAEKTAEKPAESAPPEETTEKTDEPAEQEKRDKPPEAQADPPAEGAEAISGTWSGRFLSDRFRGERARFTLVVKMAADGKISGSYESAMTEGTIAAGRYDPKGKKLTLSVDTERSTISFTATVDGEKLTGEFDVNDGAFVLNFEATRTGDAGASKQPDDGYEWKSIKDLLPGPRWVSSLEASRHQASRAYVTFDGHRSDDDELYVFVAENYGRTWRSIRANLPLSAGSARVVREDRFNPDVLYLGTEFAAWVTIDRGQSWTKLNGNLPTVAVHDIAIHPTAGEIVAATHGRSLWVLDVTALRQMTAATVTADAYLYRPGAAVRWRRERGRGASGTRRFIGQNPPEGAHICYSLGRDAAEVTLTIRNLYGRVIHQFPAQTKAGLHRVSWNLRPAARPRGGQGPGRRSRRAPSVSPGSYLVTLTVDGTEYKQELKVELDPDYPEAAITSDELELMEELQGTGEEEEGEEEGEDADRDD